MFTTHKHPSVLLTDKSHPILKELLLKYGISCTELSANNIDEILNVINDYDGIVVRSKFIIDKAFVDRCPNLRCIGRIGSGMETIDVAYANSKGIVCLNSPEGNRDAVAEHAMAMLLCLLHKIALADKEVRAGLWQREANRGFELKGQTVGIIGFGNMGAAFAKRLQSFDVSILAYDKYKKDYAPSYVTETDLDILLQKSDIISLHLPLTEETKYLANKHFFNSLGKDIILLNTARGEIVNTEDLVSALQTGKVNGACLDVLEYENMAADGLSQTLTPNALECLKTSEKVILTPHVAGWTVQSKKKLAEVLALKIVDFFSAK